MVQDELKERAFDNNLITDWGDVEAAEVRKLLIHEAVDELQRYWKRLRATGLRFKYLAALESGQSGKPHAHFLLHEDDAERPILKRELDAGWGRGFTLIRLAKGKQPRAAISYVVKSLGEASDQRVLASLGYRPEKPRGTRSEERLQQLRQPQPPTGHELATGWGHGMLRLLRQHD